MQRVERQGARQLRDVGGRLAGDRIELDDPERRDERRLGGGRVALVEQPRKVAAAAFAACVQNSRLTLAYLYATVKACRESPASIR